MPRKCIYCLQDDSEISLTDEHVVMVAFGTSLVIDCVCHDCNKYFGTELASQGNLGISFDMTRGIVAETIYRAMYIKEQGLQRFGSSPEPVAPPPSPPSPPEPASSSSSSAPPPPPVSQGMYKNGQYTGPSVDVFYGNVQVQATVQGGRITDVQFLDYPKDRNTSVMINNQAMPYLQSEAIQAQNAPVDIISGATYTSQGFNQSLVSALSQARN